MDGGSSSVLARSGRLLGMGAFVTAFALVGACGESGKNSGLGVSAAPGASPTVDGSQGDAGSRDASSLDGGDAPVASSYGAGDAPVGTRCPAGAGATVNPTMTGAAIQNVLNGQPAGATICFAAGLYRLSAALAPRAGQRLHGEEGAILNGAVVLTNFTKVGDAFIVHDVALATTGPLVSYAQWCEDPETYLCAYAEDVFFDGALLTRATSAASVKPGTYFIDYGARTVYLGSNPAGHRIEIGTASAAIRVATNDVIIEGLTVEMFAQYPDRGAIEFNLQTTGAKVRNVESRLNHGAGLLTVGTDTHVLYSRFHHNGQLGISGSSNSGLVVDHCDLHDNNTGGFWKIDGSAGGIKVNLAKNVTITNNFVKDNLNHGIWFDEGADDGVVSNNFVDNSAASGILIETTRRVKVSHNVVTNNGNLDSTSRGHIGCKSIGCAAGIQIHNVEMAEVAGNKLSGNVNGIGLIQTKRSPRTDKYTIPNLTNVNVHDNEISSGVNTGLVFNSAEAGFDPYAAGSNNVFRQNTYHLSSHDAAAFYWQKSLGDKMRWQGFGQDIDGTFLVP